MSNSDDEDAYLYGSDNEAEEQVTKKQKTESPGEESKEEVQEDDASDDESADSDDDIDIIIGDTGSVPATGSTVSAPAATEEESSDGKISTTTIVNKESNNESSIDINAIAEYEGKPITKLDPETLKDKPWRAPGADISDYFNYGFNEITWMAYCHKQDNLRGEFDPQKIMAKIMKGSGGGPGAPPMPPLGMMPPGMPGMPPMMPGMPPMMPGNFPMPPNMKMPPNMPNFGGGNFKKK